MIGLLTSGKTEPVALTVKHCGLDSLITNGACSFCISVQTMVYMGQTESQYVCKKVYTIGYNFIQKMIVRFAIFAGQNCQVKTMMQLKYSILSSPFLTVFLCLPKALHGKKRMWLSAKRANWNEKTFSLVSGAMASTCPIIVMTTTCRLVDLSKASPGVTQFWNIIYLIFDYVGSLRVAKIATPVRILFVTVLRHFHSFREFIDRPKVRTSHTVA